MTLVLSLFPGIGLLDRAFEEEGFCVVRGPDVLWGGDIRRFHPPAGVFDGVIGGPPCQAFGGLANFRAQWTIQPENLIPEYERVVAAAGPAWFVMENVMTAPLPTVPGYIVKDSVLNNRWFGEPQDRKRRISFGTAAGWALIIDGLAALEAYEYVATITAAHGGGRHRMRGRIRDCSRADALRLQGCPADFFGPCSPFTAAAQKKMIVQGVPLPMGRAVARAVRRAVTG